MAQHNNPTKTLKPLTSTPPGRSQRDRGNPNFRHVPGAPLTQSQLYGLNVAKPKFDILWELLEEKGWQKLKNLQKVCIKTYMI